MQRTQRPYTIRELDQAFDLGSRLRDMFETNELLDWYGFLRRNDYDLLAGFQYLNVHADLDLHNNGVKPLIDYMRMYHQRREEF